MLEVSEPVVKSRRGFASMDKEKQRAIASSGGKTAHQLKRAHEWTSEEAREAGRMGGLETWRRRRAEQGGTTCEED